MALRAQNINKKLKLMVILLYTKTQFTIHFNCVIIVLPLGHFLFYLCFGIGWSFPHDMNVFWKFSGVILVITFVNAW